MPDALLGSPLLFAKLYRLDDTISNLSAGMMSVLMAVAFLKWSMLMYTALYAALAPARAWLLAATGLAVPAWLASLAAFPLVDLGYYWFHRRSHDVQLMWLGHGVHHSGQAYNLSTALRQGGFERLCSPLFFLHMALLGYPPATFQVCKAWHSVYQFWPHTDFLAGKLPAAVEFIFNTPKHHRVHHARNAAYLRKNFAGMFIAWDRLLGTFVEEDPVNDPCVYYQAAQPATYNPLAEQVVHLGVVRREVAAQGSLPRMLKRLFIRPPQPVRTPHTEALNAGAPPPRRAAAGDHALNAYVASHFVLAMLAFLAADMVGSPRARLALKAFVALSLLSMGLLLDSWRRGRAVELARLALMGFGAMPLALECSGNVAAAFVTAAGGGMLAGFSAAALWQYGFVVRAPYELDSVTRVIGNVAYKLSKKTNGQ